MQGLSVEGHLNASSCQNDKGNGHAKGVASNADEAGEETTKGHGAPQQPQPTPHAPPAIPPNAHMSATGNNCHLGWQGFDKQGPLSA